MMTLLKTLNPNIGNPDDIYETIIEMHRGLSDEQSEIANAKLIMLLANEIGEPAILSKATDLARKNTLKHHKERAS